VFVSNWSVSKLELSLTIWWHEPDDPNYEDTETAIEYSCQTGKVIDRLNVMGFPSAVCSRSSKMDFGPS
jgi:hypothetical protein